MNSDTNILGHDGSALAAFLGGSAGLDTNECATSTFSLVCKSLRELAPCGIHDAFGEPTANHVRDLQVFDGDELMLSYNLLACEMGEIGTKIGDAFVCSLKPVDRLASVAASLDLAADGALGMGDLPLRLASKSRVCDRVTVAHCRERLQTYVDADARLNRNGSRRLRAVINNELGEPLAGAAHDTELLDCSRGVLDIASPDRSCDTRNADAFTTNAFSWRLNRKTIPPLPRLESGESGLVIAFSDTSKEMLERQINTTQRVPLNFNRHIGKRLANTSQDRHVSGLRHVRQRRFIEFVGGDALLKAVIEDRSANIKKMFQAGSLAGARIEPSG